jgi:hypothetical protein
MNFNVVKEEVYLGKIEIVSMKKVAFSISQRYCNYDISEIIDPLLIIAKQHKLNIKVTEKMVCGMKMIYLEYQNHDIVKALHILNISTVLN